MHKPMRQEVTGDATTTAETGASSPAMDFIREVISLTNDSMAQREHEHKNETSDGDDNSSDKGNADGYC